jgi:alpha-L-rhamnosidase
MEEKATDASGKTQIAETAVKYLRCEYRVDPLGIDVVKPRLSWIMESEQRTQVQSAYQILVADSKEKLRQNKGELWNSGKVNSDRSNQVAYEGTPLKSRMCYYWKVRVWGKDGKASAWSKPASWTVGLLEPEDWKAKWIGYDAEPPALYKEKEESDTLDLEGGKWIWFDEGDPKKSASIGTRFFRRDVEIASDKQVKRARFALLADNEAALFVNGQEAGKASGWKTVHTLDITGKLATGTNTLAIAVTNQGENANPAGLTGKLLIEFETGDPIAVSIDHSWKASDTEQDD